MFEPINLRLGKGSESSLKDGVCLMQAVAWFAGRKRLSDHPNCASHALSDLAISLNDSAPNQKMRNKLWPFVWLLLNSKDTANEKKREDFIHNEKRMLRVKCESQRRALYMTRKFKPGEFHKKNDAIARKYWFGEKRILMKAILMGNHGEIDPVGLDNRYQELKKILTPAS